MLNNQLNSQLNSQVNCQVTNQINCQMNSQMNNQLNQQQNCHLAQNESTNYINYSNTPSHLPCNTPSHSQCNSTPVYLQNSQNTVSFNNLVNLASQFKMTNNRVSAVESKQVNKLYVNSLNEKRKLTVQNNLIRQASFTYSNNPFNSNVNYALPNYNSTNNYTTYQPNSSLERSNHLKNLSAFLRQNKHLTNDDCHSESECSNYLTTQKCAAKCSNVELLNKNLNRPISISQQNSPCHVNYREKLMYQNCSNWPKLNTNLNESNHSNQQLNSHLTQQNAQLRLDKRLSLENLNSNDEILQINKQFDCMKSNLYWKEMKDLNYLTSSQTMPSPNKLKQQLTNAENTIASLTNLNSPKISSTTNLVDHSSLRSIDTLTTGNSTTNNSILTLNDELNELQLTKGSSPKLCSKQCSMNELKKLRLDLQQSNQKVSLLTEQLNTNVSILF